MAKHRRETKAEDVHQLLDIFAKSPFRAKESDGVTESILQRCLDLFGRDYQFSVINNPSGELCGTYPTQLVLLEYEKPSGTPAGANCDGMESLYDMKQLKEILKQARRARCRARCVMPVILYEGKHICRSATLSSGAEIYGRSGFDFLFSTQDQQTGNPQPGPSHDPQNDWQLFDRVRGNDIQLLQALNVGYICDLMVEKKKVKFLMNITSSEKVDKEQRYSGFDIFCVPYPGCEFFRQWKDSGYETDQVLFDWSQGYVDASLDIPPIHLIETLGIDWKKYKQWDLLTLTRNYVKLLLHLLKEGHKGVLVHCISGWDRTPMFVSLLRLSLWADGLIHRSLSATEVLYLTVAYDWFLFGHNLTDRLQKGEEIMYFCFHFLKYITSEEFSLKPHSAANHRKSSKSSEVSDVEGPVGGVLIDVDHPTACTHRGSDSSLNSSGNTVPDSDLLSANQDQPLTNGSVCINTRSLNSQPELSAHYSPVGSSPMPVPNHLRHINDITVAQSPVSGSWQIISGMESYGCLSSSLGTSLDLDSIGGSFRSSRRSSHTSSCSEATEQEISVRWQRLNDVWRVFSNAYTNKISIRYGTASTGLGTLLDAFAGKVGIRNNPV